MAFVSMAGKAIDTDRAIGMAILTEAVFPYDAIGFGVGMAIDTTFEAKLLATDTLMNSVNTLMEDIVHMVLTHFRGRRDHAFITSTLEYVA